MFKINNSYETEPSTSSSSLSNDCASTLTAEWDFQKGTALRDFLFPCESNIGKVSASDQPNKKVSSIVNSSQESDFYGFTPKSVVAAIETGADSLGTANETIEQKPPFSGSLIHKAIALTECGSAQTIGSEEFSDQDVRCRIEMSKNELRLQEQIEDNANPCNVSHFSIEPTSSDGEEEVTIRTNVLKIHDSSSNLHTLSINENSNNAVDNAILETIQLPAVELTDLSFNGKLKPEPMIKKTTTWPNEIIQTEKESKKDLNISNVSDNENENERSPDLFSDEDDYDADNNEHSTANVVDTIIEPNDAITDGDVNDSIEVKNIEDNDKSIEKTEKAMSERIQAILGGIRPPPSVTHIQHDITNLLSMYKRNATLHEPTIFNDKNNDENENCDQLTTPIMPKVLDNIEWPQLKRINAYGVHYNCTKYSDNIDVMFMKLVERNVGQETGSSFTFAISTSAKKKPVQKLMASPGNRLSHSARRRAMFSSANLQSQSQLSNLSKLGQKTCLIDASKLSRKEKVATPKRRLLANRRTPGRKTSGSLRKSASKVVTIAPKCGTATRETSKRALFLSPTQDEVKSLTPSISSDISRREKSKRALFSPPRRLERSISNISNMSSQSSSTSFGMFNSGSNTKNPIERVNYFNRTNSDLSISYKRRLETDDNENIEPHRSKFQRTEHQNNTLIKAASENSMYQSQQLSASHRQKLLWAVSTALKKKSITSTNSNFNTYASILGKVVKRLYLESLATKTESTSGTMLKLADRLVFWVLKGKSVDEIYLEEKARMDTNKTAAATKRLSGYINRDEYLMRTESSKLNSSSQSIEQHCSANENDSGRKPLTNSSSKSNVGTSALRENHDSKSAQKSTSNVSFSSRNQKKLSPYNDKSRSMTNSNKPNKLMPGTNSNILKVKRQISFDN